MMGERYCSPKSSTNPILWSYPKALSKTADIPVEISVCLSVEDIRATIKKKNVILIWKSPGSNHIFSDQSETSLNLIGHEIKRDGKSLTTVSLIQTYFSESDLQDGRYLYKVYALYKNGILRPVGREVAIFFFKKKQWFYHQL